MLCQLGARPQISVRGRDDDNLGPTFLSTWVSPAAELSRAEIDGGWRVAVCGCGHQWITRRHSEDRGPVLLGTLLHHIITMQAAALLLATLAVISQTMQTAHSQPVRDVSEQH